MASNFGKTIQVSTFGASHGYAIGGIVEGLPCGAAEYRDYESYPQAEVSQDEWCPETYINWDAYWYGDCVSLVMFRYDGGTDPGYSRGWCFDFATEKQVSVTEMLQRMRRQQTKVPRSQSVS